MTTAYPIPNYEGEVQVAAPGATIGDGIIIPCARILFRDDLSVDSLYSAASSPRPDTFPGFSEPGMLEFWCPSGKREKTGAPAADKGAAGNAGEGSRQLETPASCGRPADGVRLPVR
ncbi:MAG TPA: hypothetical protein VHX65_16935, partial [Pirellulales bacterium]|nr:hypothetical protein [Pirellulales bacterium]